MAPGIGPLRIVGKRTAGASFAIDLDQKSVARGRKLLDRYRDKPLDIRMQRATLAAAKVMESPIRAASPVSHDKDPGQMKRSVLARSARLRRSFVVGKGWRTRASTEALVGPRTSHSHLAIRSHRIVTRSGRDTGLWSRPNPFVDVVADRLYRRAIAEMRRHIFETRY